jgi:AraC family transcriptional regulator, regulatory protein of adaptative response / methylated-DNA-[protein]-cysteine methyltransferase
MSTAIKSIELAKAMQSDTRWASVVARDDKTDGTFYYSVKTTGVYCRPSCAARLAHPENVQFYESSQEAEKAGFRPCKRCRPTQAPLAEQHAAKIAKVCRLIERSETCPR